MFKKLSIYKFPLILFISILLGSIVGLIFGDKASVLEPFGKVFTNILFTLVIPLVFFSISSSITKIDNMNRLGKTFKYMLLIFIITSLIAATFMLISVLIFNIGTSGIDTSSYTKENINIFDNIVSMITVTNFYELLSKNNILPLIIFSILFGFSTRLVNSKELNNLLDSISKVMLKMINIVMYYAPIGLFAYFATQIGIYGKEFIGMYAKSFILYLIMSILYYIIFYSIYAYLAYKKKGIKIFYKNILLSTITSLATSSSLASLPVNIKTANKIGIDKDISSITLPIGASIHMEGSSMASILKIAFLFSFFGKSFSSITDILVALLIAVLSGVVMSGIPGGGLIGESLIVSLYGFPDIAFPMIATIGWLVDAPATMLNVVGDIPSSMLINKLVNNES